MSWFSDQITSGLETIREHAGEAITYKTASATITIALAVRGKGEQVEEAADRITLSSDDLDWLIAREDLVSGLTAIEPAPGHTITCVEGNQTVTYAAAATENKQCWEWSDAGHTQYRIHTKRITTA